MSSCRRILHLAPFNTSGVPITCVRAERRLGWHSRLITFGRDPRGYEEDVCLELPLLDFAGLRWAKRLFSHPDRLQVNNTRHITRSGPPQWQPHTRAEQWLLQLREWLWTPAIQRALAAVDFWNFDVYQFDGGMEFYRDGRLVRELKRRGKTIICLYTGSDLRTRGLVPAVDRQADLRLTLEFDHLLLDPSLHHLFFPFEFERYVVQPAKSSGPLVIGHAPTNRHAKGSELIIAAVQSLAGEFPVRLELIEGMPHAEAMRRKAACDIFIDNLGELGYGVNAIEALALGICTCTSLMPDFSARYPDHGFVEITAQNLVEKLRWLCRHPDERMRLARAGRAWALAHHGAQAVVQHIHHLLHRQQHAHSVHQ
ncbi:MAG: glycosyltransferase [candidate division KSB1 bacterium]|nr:glycosyltransferase [candidate division KSB1 bacterium]MDZ7276062.1 glycosyltransferase [candidate division KSB1 bacterium]MDZ7285656.1 glycosyltransferase [candidate division KSB1 bacterium]MDZ7298688.1 glycosyltransferase [candidate division KSB1 bacterium]MDZ7308404.1 glycosyltransferase [candidate division KSB1 bacterium]